MTTSEVEQLFGQLRFERDDRAPPTSVAEGSSKRVGRTRQYAAKNMPRTHFSGSPGTTLAIDSVVFWVIDPRGRSMRLTRYWLISTPGHRLATEGKPYGRSRGT
jgi:hypothetical protein